MIIDFKKNIRGAYELYANKKATGVSFFIPNGFKIEDYADKIEYIGNSQSNNICFRITSSPSQFGKAHIESINEINFKDGLVVNVAENIYIGLSKNISLCADTSGKSLSFDSFILRSNQDTTFNFSSELATKEDRKSKDEVEKDFTVTGNTNGIFNFRDDIEHLTLQNSFFMKTYPTDPIMGDLNSVTFNSKNVSFGQGQFYFGDAQSSMDFSSDEIDMKESYLEIKNGKTIVAQTGKDFSTLVMIEAQFIGGLTRLFTKDPSSSSYGSDEVHSLVTNSPRLHFNPNSLTSENNILDQAQILSHDDLVVENGAIKESKLAFAKKEDKEYYINEISGFGSESCDLKGIKGTLNGRLEYVSGEGLVIGKDSGIYIIENNDTSKDEKTHKPHCEIRNVKVVKDSQLSVYMATPKDGNKSEVVLINNVVNSGTIKNAGSLTITNCELNHAEIIQNDKSVETKCSNSVFSGENSLYCVESIDCSTITNCVLYPESKEVVTPLNIKDEELDGIKNYTKYKELSEVKEIIKNSVKQRDSFEEFENL